MCSSEVNPGAGKNLMETEQVATVAKQGGSPLLNHGSEKAFSRKYHIQKIKLFKIYKSRYGNLKYFNIF